MRERDIQDEIRLAASRAGAVLFRNNVALAWVGEVIRAISTRTVLISAGDVVIRNARPLHAGLHVGSPDLFGWTPVTVTAEMVGSKLAIVTGMECKTPRGRVSDHQENFINRMRNDGGIAIVARCPGDATGEIGKWTSTKTP